MARADRIKLIQELQELREAKLVCYLTGDRPSDIPIRGMSAWLAQEPQYHFYEQLQKVGKTERLDLLLYTRGGDMNSVWPLVSIMREFCDHLTVLVPFRAHSAGTMICLGADEVRMGKMGELSPIDPTTGTPFNPLDEIQKGSRKGISVEDVRAYLELARETFGINGEQNQVAVLQSLTDKVEPLALGNVKRVQSQVRALARKLLQLGPHGADSEEGVESIASSLVEKFHSHFHFINRREARELLGESMVRGPREAEETTMWQLFMDFAHSMKLTELFVVREFMGNDIAKELDIVGGFIESEGLSHVFKTRCRIHQRSQLPPNYQLQLQPGQLVPLVPGFPVAFDVEVVSQGWRREDENRDQSPRA